MSFRFNWNRLDETSADALRLLINAKLNDVIGAKFRNHHAPSSHSATTPSGVDEACGPVPTTTTANAMGATDNTNHHANATAMDPASTGASGTAGTTIGGAAATTATGNTSNNNNNNNNNNNHNNNATATSNTTTGNQNSNSNSKAASSAKLPPIEFLTISGLEWGNASPYIQLVSFENAKDESAFTATSSSYTFNSNQQQKQNNNNNSGSNGNSTPVNAINRANTNAEVGGSSTTTNNNANSTTNAATAASTALVDGGGAVLPTFDSGSDTISSAAGGGGPTVAGAGNGGGTGNKTLGYNVASNSNLNLCSNPSASMTSVATNNNNNNNNNNTTNNNNSSTNTRENGVDTLARFFGPGGLLLRFHITYGGSLRLTARTAVQHELRMGALALTVRMPVTISVTDIDLDCHVCFNIHHNMCRVWMEPGKLSSSVLNRMNVVVAFGERSGPYAPEDVFVGGGGGGALYNHSSNHHQSNHNTFETMSSSNATTTTTTTAAAAAMGVTPPLNANSNHISNLNHINMHTAGGAGGGGGGLYMHGGGLGLGLGGVGGGNSFANSTDFISHYNSSYSTADAEEDETGGGGGGTSVYVDETEIGQFIQEELRAVMEEKIMAPHYISIPMELDGV